jgi:pyruvate dehydrogenase E2 component (dihydrolipoamide acetyltransferase)
MTNEFKLPDLGENVESGDIVGLLVSVGDTINVDDPVIELETDKATVEVPSPLSGKITAIHVSEGDTVTVGQLVLTVEAAEEGEVASPEPEAVEETEASGEEQPGSDVVEAAEMTEAEMPQAVPASVELALVEVELPDLGENIESGTVVGILVSEGDTVEQDQPILELETDKATVEVPSTTAGVVKSVHIQEGDEVLVGGALVTLETGARPEPDAAAKQAGAQVAPVEEKAAKPQPAEPQVEVFEEPEPAVRTEARVSSTDLERTDVSRLMVSARGLELPVRPDRTLIPAAPNVRRIARELGVNIGDVNGTGPNNRILMDDVKRHAYRLLRALRAGLPVGQAGTEQPSAPPLPDFSKWGEIERQAMSNIRRATARQMATAWSNIPHVTQFHKADITDLEQLRKQFGKKVEESGGKLTITAILLKVVAGALKEFPKFNASIDVVKDEVVFKNYYHIGVAVDTDRGLLVPVIRDVDQKNIIELAVELGEVAAKARERKLKLDDMQGGTFTITNLGGIGGTNFTPIVNSPEVAILGVARGGKEPVFSQRTEQFEPRLMLPLALSYDHRLIDGADGARFLSWIVNYLEQPFLTALQGW